MNNTVYFGQVIVADLPSRSDRRGARTLLYSDEEFAEIFDGFVMKEQRVYHIAQRGTFFGIHYQDMSLPQARLVTVIKGGGIDYVIDMRPESETYRQWVAIELIGRKNRFVYIPAGFGHAFLATEDHTIQCFALSEHNENGLLRTIHYKDPGIGLELPMEVTVISDRDRTAPFWCW